tara:strand:- start:2712 stop:4007 length:1296 start_codon:yes stop_codon:yes gene_type:complete
MEINNLIWKKAEKIIPGGNGLLSKRPLRFLPNGWPTYFKKAKGINIWTLQNKKYIDFSIMGVGTAILGYANSTVDQKVKKAIDAGINTTLNCIEEFELAKELLKFDKFAQQVKFAKGGGEAMAMAIRVARSNTKKYKVVFSGYHGWHDWYISANLSNLKNLNNHLLKNLKPKGIPKTLKNSILPLKFNDTKSLEKIFKKEKFAGILVIEGARNEFPSKEFVKKINDLKKNKNIILIVDEITSGWRETLGGVYNKVGLKPDIVVYGKALGNGYPISALVGKKKIMNKSKETFISSTAWTERLGFVAALATINFLKKKRVPPLILTRGKKIINGWKKIAKKNNLEIDTNEFYSMPSFNFNYKNLDNEKLHTLFTELMLKKGYISTNYMFVTYAHKEKEINKYLKNCDFTFKFIREKIEDKKFFYSKETRKMTY